MNFGFYESWIFRYAQRCRDGITQFLNHDGHRYQKTSKHFRRTSNLGTGLIWGLATGLVVVLLVLLVLLALLVLLDYDYNWSTSGLSHAGSYSLCCSLSINTHHCLQHARQLTIYCVCIIIPTHRPFLKSSHFITIII